MDQAGPLFTFSIYLKELYYLFEIKPYTRIIPRSLRKEGKVYLLDYSSVPNPAARFENLVASHLLKACHYSASLRV
jgi:predicted AAA+ superfamily ATPase